MNYERHVVVLVVDDDTAIRRYISRILRGVGCRVLEAADAVEGLAALRFHGGVIDLAIIDFIMPRTSGLDLALEFDRLRPGLKILYTSGCIESVAIKSIGQNRPDILLPKPFTPSSLVSKVQGLVPC